MLATKGNLQHLRMVPFFWNSFVNPKWYWNLKIFINLLDSELGFICNSKKVIVRFPWFKYLELFLILMKLFNQFQQKGGEGGMYVFFV